MIYDTVVIGAGIAGLCCTYFLTKKLQNVLLLEKNNSFNNNTSAAAAGLLSPIKFHTYPQQLQKLCIEAITFYPEFLKELNTQYLIQSKGELILSNDKNELVQIQNSLEKFNFSSTILTGEFIRKKFPYLSKNINYGLLTDDVYSINNNIFLDRLYNTIIERAKVLFSANAYSIESRENTIIAVKTNLGDFEAKNFIFATGAENIYFSKELFDIHVKGIKGILLELTGNHKTTIPVVFNHYYTVPRNSITLLAGTVVKENDLTSNIYVEYIDEIITNIKYFYTDITKLSLKEIRCGHRPYIDGRHTICEASTKFKNAYILNGLFRNGILLAPYLSHLLVKKYF